MGGQRVRKFLFTLKGHVASQIMLHLSKNSIYSSRPVSFSSVKNIKDNFRLINQPVPNTFALQTFNFNYIMQFKDTKIDIETRLSGQLTMVHLFSRCWWRNIYFFCFGSAPQLHIGDTMAIFTSSGVFKVMANFTNFLKNAIAYVFNPKTRIWNKGGANVHVEIYQPKTAKKVDPYENKRYSKEDFERIAEILDKRGRVNSSPPN